MTNKGRKLNELTTALGIVQKGFAWVDNIGKEFIYKGAKISEKELNTLQRSHEVLIWKEVDYL